MPYRIDSITADTISVLKEITLNGGPISSLIDQEIQIESFGLDLTFSEETDYTLPLTKQVTTNFKGLSHETERITIESEGEFKVVSKSLLGLVDALYITELFGELFQSIGEDENNDFFNTLFSGKLTLDYKIDEVYDYNILLSKMISISLNGGPVYNLSPGSKFEIFYVYFNPEWQEIPHEVKFTVQENFFNFSLSPTTSDFPIIERFNINTEGVVNLLNPIIILNNLPGEDAAELGQIYVDENGFIKVKEFFEI